MADHTEQPDEPGPEDDLAALGRQLEELLLEHQGHIYSSPEAEGAKPNRRNINKKEIGTQAKINRNRLAEIFAGRERPTPAELRRLLALLPAGAVDIEAWVSAFWPRRRGPAGPYDAESDGLHELNSWSYARPMTPEGLQSAPSPRPPQRWVDPTVLEAARPDDPDADGELVYLIGIDIDHRESPGTDRAEVRLADSTYADAVALMRLRSTQPDALARADAALAADPAEYLDGAVPTSFNINMVLLSAEREAALCVRRSSAVGSASGSWTVGVIETMKRSDADVAELAWRCAHEELGLTSDVAHIELTWLGLYRPILRGHLVAIATTPLTDAEVLRRVGQARDSYETSVPAWIPIDDLRAEIMPAASAGASDGHPLLAGASRTWVGHSRLAAHEAARYLERPPAADRRGR